MKLLRRLIQSAVVAAVVGLASAGTHAADPYPSKPVVLVVNQAAGGGADAMARIFGQKMSEITGQPFIIETRAGAGGNVGTVYVAKAPKDGYTLLVTLSSSHVVNPALYSRPGFDPIKDFEPITTIATAPYLLVSNPQFPPKNVKELIAYAKSKPGEINYGSAGNGTLNHLLGEMLKTTAKIDLFHVPYKAGAAMLTDVVGGQVPRSFLS